jgi:hypothetical protein
MLVLLASGPAAAPVPTDEGLRALRATGPVPASGPAAAWAAAVVASEVLLRVRMPAPSAARETGFLTSCLPSAAA